MYGALATSSVTAKAAVWAPVVCGLGSTTSAGRVASITSVAPSYSATVLAFTVECVSITVSDTPLASSTVLTVIVCPVFQAVAVKSRVWLAALVHPPRCAVVARHLYLDPARRGDAELHRVRGARPLGERERHAAARHDRRRDERHSFGVVKSVLLS